MRQINIKELGKHLSAEMKNLPFTVIKRGKFIGIMIAPGMMQGTDLETESTDNEAKLEGKGTDKPKYVHNPVESVKGQLVDIVKKKTKCTQSKATIATGGRPTNAYSKEYQLGKKGKA